MYWQHVISMVCLLAACHSYDLCTGSMSYVWCVYGQRVIILLCILAASHSYGVITGSVP